MNLNTRNSPTLTQEEPAAPLEAGGMRSFDLELPISDLETILTNVESVRCDANYCPAGYCEKGYSR